MKKIYFLNLYFCLGLISHISLLPVEPCLKYNFYSRYHQDRRLPRPQVCLSYFDSVVGFSCYFLYDGDFSSRNHHRRRNQGPDSLVSPPPLTFSFYTQLFPSFSEVVPFQIYACSWPRAQVPSAASTTPASRPLLSSFEILAPSFFIFLNRLVFSYRPPLSSTFFLILISFAFQACTFPSWPSLLCIAPATRELTGACGLLWVLSLPGGFHPAGSTFAWCCLSLTRSCCFCLWFSLQPCRFRHLSADIAGVEAIGFAISGCFLGTAYASGAEVSCFELLVGCCYFAASRLRRSSFAGGWPGSYVCFFDFDYYLFEKLPEAL